MEPAASVVLECLDRVHELIPAVVQESSIDDLLWRPDPGSNSAGWLIWHLLRTEDGHLAQIGGRDQLWLAEGWRERFGLPYLPAAGGFGMTPEEVGQFTLSDAAALTGYADAVAAMAAGVLQSLTADDLARVIDTRWDPPVTVSVRLVSVVIETAQHIGQAAYLKGLRERATGTDSGWQGYPA